jgi:hypothetical protein
MGSAPSSEYTIKPTAIPNLKLQPESSKLTASLPKSSGSDNTELVPVPIL